MPKKAVPLTKISGPQGILLTVLPSRPVGSPTKPPPAFGPGTALQKILKDLGFTLKASCGCQDRMLQMNIWGVAGCRENRELIAHWLQEAAEEITVRETFMAAARGIFQGILLNPVGIYTNLVDLAIQRAEHEMELRDHDGSRTVEHNIPTDAGES